MMIHVTMGTFSTLFIYNTDDFKARTCKVIKILLKQNTQCFFPGSPGWLLTEGFGSSQHGHSKGLFIDHSIAAGFFPTASDPRK